MAKKRFVNFSDRRSVVVDGKWAYEDYVRGPVRVMAVAEGYAMVRFSGAMPFCIAEKRIIEEVTP